METQARAENLSELNTIQFAWIALEKREAECFSEVFAVPLELAEGILPGSIFVSIPLAIQANQKLADSGFSPALRGLIDKYLHTGDFATLKSLIGSVASHRCAS